MFTRPHVRSCATLIALLTLTSITFDASAGRLFGRGHAFALGELPISRLKSRLEQLPESRRMRALAWLNRITFPEADLPQLSTDAEGGVLYVDPAPVQAANTLPAAAPAAAATTIPTSDALLLHSRPGAPNVIYLDFDGHTLTGTAWNQSTGRTTLTALPYDTDGVPALPFSTSELTSIINIWRRVSEDFAPFNVDVTTQLPASFGPRTARVLITKDSDAFGVAMPWQGAGGVAYIDVFGYSNYTYYQPALVYYNRLGNGREDYVAEAASHETGHNLGLSHDATATASYYGGHGAGATSWGPIMGTGYNRAVSQWSRGEYTGASNTEDDVAKITTKLGARPDDASNTSTGAVPLVIGSGGSVTSTTVENDWRNTQPQNKGVIGSQSDVDVFQFDAGTGAVSLTATPHRMPVNTAGGNLDVQLQLFNSGGALIGTASPNGATGSTLAATLPAAGRYFLHVSGVGDPTVPYGDYGSLGQYALNGTIPVTVADTTPPAPNPMSFEQNPVSTSATTLSMRAATAIDPQGSAVQYQFQCTSGGAGCVTSAWQGTRDFVASGLSPGALYRYRVLARDASGNATAPSTEVLVMTPYAPPPQTANRPPVAAADALSVVRRNAANVNVLANDTDPNGDKLTITAFTQGALGTVKLVSGQLRYTAGGKTGSDAFQYTVADGKGGQASAVVMVTVRAR